MRALSIRPHGSRGLDAHTSYEETTSSSTSEAMTESSFIQNLRQFHLASLACLLSISGGVTHAEVRLPAIFADHMVVQRDMPMHVWGHASPGEAVTVTFRGESKRTAADALGRWSLYLSPGSAGGPFEMQVQGANRIALEDVLAGDVWIASGQSNMEFPVAGWDGESGVKNKNEEIAAANYRRIRLLDIHEGSSDSPMDDAVIRHAWSECTPASVGTFSAVGYFFARDLQQYVHVPIDRK